MSYLLLRNYIQKIGIFYGSSMCTGQLKFNRSSDHKAAISVDIKDTIISSCIERMPFIV